MPRLTDAQVRGKGTPVKVNNVEDLVIYHGKLKPVFSAPCENWFEDNDPLAAVPTGYIAVRQLSSGCLAFLAKDKLETLDYAKNKSEALYLSENESEVLDRSENKREKLRRSKNNIEDWSEIGIIAAILAFFFPNW